MKPIFSSAISYLLSRRVLSGHVFPIQFALLTAAAVKAEQATGVYWKPMWHILNDGDFKLVLANAAHVKKIHGVERSTKTRTSASTPIMSQ